MVTKAKPASAPAKKPVAKLKAVATTNTTPKSAVSCEVKLESGEWIQPESCKTFYIDEDSKFPDITYEIKTDEPGPYEWSWDIKWVVMACQQRWYAKDPKTHKDTTTPSKRFKPNAAKTFSATGSFTSADKSWKADLTKLVIGGELTVKVKVGAKTFVRKTQIRGKQPDESRVKKELDTYAALYPHEVDLAKKIFRQESKFRHFFSDEMPLVSFDNGYGLGQATSPVPSYEQTWNWKKHVEYIVATVIKEKRRLAKKYLDSHPGYGDEELDTETLVYYNGANFHYYVWSEAEKKWVINSNIVCDPDQSNKGWNMSIESNKNKTLKELQDGKGGAAIYTGRCYAEHIKKNN